MTAEAGCRPARFQLKFLTFVMIKMRISFDNFHPESLKMFIFGLNSKTNFYQLKSVKKEIKR